MRSLLAAALSLALGGCQGGADTGAKGDDRPVDADGDGYNSVADCDDSSADVFPGAEERCNGIDDNCNGEIDEAGAVGGVVRYVDSDGDGVGSDEVVTVCDDDTSGTAAITGDCDDSDPSISPLATELCDGVDNNCDGRTDEPGTPDGILLPIDRDGDGYGHPLLTGIACGPGDGFATNTTDCDDGDPDRNPGVPENCANGVDDDCDGVVDETDDPNTPVWYADDDGDGYAGTDTTLSQCAPPPGYSARATDCDDTDPDIHPDQPDKTDGVDNDCDGVIDELGDSTGSGTLTLAVSGHNACTLTWKSSWEELDPTNFGDYTWQVINTFKSRLSQDESACAWAYGSDDFTVEIAWLPDTFGTPTPSVWARSGDAPFQLFGYATLDIPGETLDFTRSVETDNGDPAKLTGTVSFQGL